MLSLQIIKKSSSTDKTIIKENVQVSSEDDVAKDTLLVVMEGALIFRENPNYLIGDVIVSGITFK